MGDTTEKGYPYPVGTDRVMDGDNAIQALAEAVDADAQFSHALPTGQAIAAQTVVTFGWNAATENGCELTKASGTNWTVTQAGLYVITMQVNLQYSQDDRAFIELWCGKHSARAVFTGDGHCAATMAQRAIVGDTIKGQVWLTEAGSILAGGAGGYLNVLRLGRSTATTQPA